MKVPMLLKNKYVLYSLLLIGVVNILGYIALEDYNSMALIIILGVLSSYFSKNMSVNLLIAIVGTSLVAINNKVTEGFVEGKEAIPTLKTESKPTTESKPPTATTATATEASTTATATEAAAKNKKMEGAPKDALKRTVIGDEGGRKSTNTTKIASASEAKGLYDRSLGDRNIAIPEDKAKQVPCSSCDPDDTACQKKCSGFQNNVPSSSPARVDDEDESIGDRIDYASTMEQAYDNLQKMLGEGGMKNITAETQKLVSQQKNLMSTLHEMAPVLKTAKETLATMNLPDMGQISNLMKKFAGNK